MKKLLYTFFILLGFCLNAQTVVGKTINEDGANVGGIQVVNVTTDAKAVSAFDGEFTISAKEGDEIRFVSVHYARFAMIVTADNLKNKLVVKLSPFVQEIAPVNFEKMTLEEKTARMYSNLGIPTGPEKPREQAPPTREKVGTFNYLVSNLNVFNLYKNISGDARRMRSAYRYDDSQDDLTWVITNLGTRYFDENNIPPEKRRDFIQYAMGKENVAMYIKARNITSVEFALSRYLPDYLKLLEKK